MAEEPAAAVTSVSGTKTATYCYDANGNMVSGDSRSISYSGFDLPTTTTTAYTLTGHLGSITANLIKPLTSPHEKVSTMPPNTCQLCPQAKQFAGVTNCGEARRLAGPF